jgi:hypothetical protein
MSIIEIGVAKPNSQAYIPTLREFAKIIRGEHPNWRGDRILNAETFLRDFRDQDLAASNAMGQAIEEDISYFSKQTDLPFKRLHQMANLLCKRVDTL